MNTGRPRRVQQKSPGVWHSLAKRERQEPFQEQVQENNWCTSARLTLPGHQGKCSGVCVWLCGLREEGTARDVPTETDEDGDTKKHRHMALNVGGYLGRSKQRLVGTWSEPMFHSRWARERGGTSGDVSGVNRQQNALSVSVINTIYPLTPPTDEWKWLRCFTHCIGKCSHN